MLSRNRVGGVLSFVGVLMGLVALWEGYRAIGGPSRSSTL
jgi:hypothetical protein